MVSLPDDKGSGGNALAGLDYQIDVSVWLALDLMLASRLTDELELEPASEEDIEAVLAPNEAGAVVSAMRLFDQGNPYRLVVQAKLRSGDPWRVSDMNALLKHGSHSRIDQLCTLQRPPCRRAKLDGSLSDAKALRQRRPAFVIAPHRGIRSLRS